MQDYDVYADIAQRTNGDVYLGVVGPVRTGKSTFIKRFMEYLVLPNISDVHERVRAGDEMPQSGVGKTIMTTQPHFVPNEAVRVDFGEHAHVNLRLIDCVGYMVDGAFGMTEEDVPRLVRTPWFEEDIPFEQAAEYGTRKVITDHANVGIVMTSDGSFTGISRQAYAVAEARAIEEIKAQGKPFAVILNSSHPNSPQTKELAESMQLKYGVPIRVLDVLNMDEEDIEGILEDLLLAFLLLRVDFKIPKWAQTLGVEHELIARLLSCLQEDAKQISHMRDVSLLKHAFDENMGDMTLQVEQLDLGTGNVTCRVDFAQELFYGVLSKQSGYTIKDDCDLMEKLEDLAHAKLEYDRLHDALESAKTLGYGFVYPRMEEMKLEDPEIVRQGGRFGVSLKASAPALQISRIDIETQVSPIMGTEKQSEELVDYLSKEFETDPARMWSTNVFGKSLNELVQEGLNNKLSRMPDDVQRKMTETMRRIINDGHGGVICVLL